MDGRGSFSVVSLSEYFAFLSCPNVSLVTEVTVHQASTTVCSVVIFLYNSSKPYYPAEEWITSRAIKSARKEGRQGQTKHNTRSSKIILRLWRLLLLLFPSNVRRWIEFRKNCCRKVISTLFPGRVIPKR